jgi:hypothetical protein
MQKIIVKNFWIDPENPPISGFSKFSFGYNNKGKDFKYDVAMNPGLKGSEESLHKMFWIIRDSKKGSYLPWTAVSPDIKSKLRISNADDPQTSFLSELVTKVASRLEVLDKLLRWL